MKQFKCNKDTAVVTTTRGKVRGYEYDGMSIFKGIPYAKAERFHRPEEVPTWDDVLECTSYGYVCPLRSMDKPMGELNVPHRYWVMNEDCQNLNVWTPACDDKKRPVVVWLHGGGFEAGSAIEHQAYEGENMCKLGDVVVVSINHRLNFLGYLDLSEFGEEYANSGNAGTDDMVAALRWVRDNIEKFGGDPARVTIMGQSGGGAKVTTLLQTPEADGLFSGGIVMSGNYAPMLHDSKGSAKEFVEAIMAELGVDGVKELETVKYDRLADAYNKLMPEYAAKGANVGGSPCPNRFYAGMPVDNGFREETRDIPLLIGTVFGEFSAFVTENYDRSKLTRDDAVKLITDMLGKEGAEAVIPLFEKAYPDRHLVDLLSLDFMFRAPNIPYVMKRAALNNNTYSYFFNHNTAMDYERVPWHCFDIAFAFHNIDMVPSAMFEGAEELQEEVFNSVLAFIKTGNPNNPAVPQWPACDAREEHIMFFDDNTRVLTNHDHELMPVYARYMGPAFGKMMAENAGKAQH